MVQVTAKHVRAVITLLPTTQRVLSALPGPSVERLPRRVLPAKLVSSTLKVASIAASFAMITNNLPLDRRRVLVPKVSLNSLTEPVVALLALRRRMVFVICARKVSTRARTSFTVVASVTRHLERA